MAKKSLIISDKEKYGDSMAATIAGSGKKGKPSEPKHAPVMDLTSSQVKAFGLETAQVDQTGCAMIHYIVKSASAGDSYGDAVVKGSGKKKVSIQITHVDPDCEAPAEDGEGSEEGDGESGTGKEDDTGGADAADSSDADAEDNDSKPKAEAKDTVSPKESGLADDTDDDEED